jgi:thymidylate synthase ThyX
LNNTLKVELIRVPQITHALREFVECGPMARAPRFVDEDKALEFLISENALWQGMETLHFDFRVTGCSRMLTHQLVRQRIGITFSQQCSDSVDWRHHNIVQPRALNPNCTVEHAIEGKILYAKEMDEHNVPCQVARYILPQCLETFLYIHASLATLVFMIKKRICTMSQPWETHLWAALTTATIVRKMPMLAKLFEPDCSKGTCFYHRAKENPASAYLYQPDMFHGNEKFEWNPDSYIHKDTNSIINDSGSPHQTKYYRGRDEISLEMYKEKAIQYELKI